MAVYPGGTWWNKTTRGHRFWENFLCDLLHRHSLSGAPNFTAARLAEIGMLAMVISIVCAFSLAPELVVTHPRLGRFFGWFGVISTPLLAAAPLLPSDRYPTAHSVAVVFGTLPTLIAFTGLVATILIEPLAQVSLRALTALLLLLLVVCATLYTWNVYFGGPSLKALPAVERLATLVLLAWLALLDRFVDYGFRSKRSKSSSVATNE
jgi:hypothetical protein